MALLAILFDCDGTILDSRQTIRRCVNATVKEFGFPEFTEEEFKTFYGCTLHEILRKRTDRIEDMVDYYRKLMLSTFAQDTKVFPHILPVLNYLKGAGVPMGVLTMRSAEITEKILAHFGLMPYFQAVYGCDNTKKPKPSPDAVVEFASMVNVPVWQVGIVGDTKFDMLTAKNAGATGIGVLWGSGSMEDLLAAGADYLVPDGNALIEILKMEMGVKKHSAEI
ncbi:MAG: HAD family hydrolase [Thermoplasmata archaeon]|nr:HAD family hydrolase [Thermoplasmata archaeon]